MEFEIKQKVVHCSEGICVIEDIKEINGDQYFLLTAERGGGENIYIPVNKASNIIRELLTKKEADKILRELKNIEFFKTINAKQRRDEFKRRLASGSVLDIGFLYKQKLLMENDENMKIGPADADMLNKASDILLDELSISYKISRDSIEKYILKKIR